jgi:uncharacterized protein
MMAARTALRPRSDLGGSSAALLKRAQPLRVDSGREPPGAQARRAQVRPARVFLAAAMVAACAGPATPEGGRVPRAAGPTAVPSPAPTLVAEAKGPLPWATFDAETFARAKRERRFVVLDGSAEWCHWCHVMEATTYHDPVVRAVLDAHFIAIKVDVDTRPDVLERYGDWGFPATIVFDPDAEEIAKYRGFIEPARFAELLREIATQGTKSRVAQEPAPEPGRRIHGAERMALLREVVQDALDERFDDKEGGWGTGQKAPIGVNNAWLLRLASRGDPVARHNVLFTLQKQSALLDPVWGGIYQYSAASDWNHPHFEKLQTFQALALENYAQAFKLTGDSMHRQRALALRGYIDRFLRSPEGTFYATQDADLNAHAPSVPRTTPAPDAPFMDGQAYYALSESERLRRGVPRVDTGVYGRENGLGIAAYVTLFEALGDASALAVAKQAGAALLRSHVAPNGAISHDGAKDPKRFFLSDNASVGYALLRLYQHTQAPADLVSAERIAAFLDKELWDTTTGAFFVSSFDPDAAGVFARRRLGFEENVMAVRFLAALHRVRPNARTRELALSALSAITTLPQVKARGRWLGDLLLALDEARDL